MEYVRSLLPTTQELFGAEEAGRLVARAARLIGLQFYEDTAAMLGIRGDSAEDFARYLGALAISQGEQVEMRGELLTQQGWRLIAGVALPDSDAAFRAWNALWEGALAAHNRFLRLKTERAGETIIWRIAAA
jgi:hypothetical protein